MQDARPLAIAVLLSGLVIGCQSSNKTVAPKNPHQIYTPVKDQGSTAKAAVKPATTNLTTTPSRAPIVNGGASMTAPPPVMLSPTPGVTQPPISAPTISTTTPVVSKSESFLPPMPPAPPDMTDLPTKPVEIPVSSPIAMPTDLK